MASINPQTFIDGSTASAGYVVVDNESGTPVWGVTLDPETGVIRGGWLKPVDGKRERLEGLYQDRDGNYRTYSTRGL